MTCRTRCMYVVGRVSSMGVAVYDPTVGVTYTGRWERVPAATIEVPKTSQSDLKGGVSAHSRLGTWVGEGDWSFAPNKEAQPGLRAMASRRVNHEWRWLVRYWVTFYHNGLRLETGCTYRRQQGSWRSWNYHGPAHLLADCESQGNGRDLESS